MIYVTVYVPALIGVLGLLTSLYMWHNVREYTRGMHFSHRSDLPYWSDRDGWIMPPKWRQHRYNQQDLEDDSI